MGVFASLVGYLQQAAPLWQGLAISVGGLFLCLIVGQFPALPELAVPALGFLLVLALIAVLAVVLTGLLRARLPVGRGVASIGLGLGAYGLLIWMWSEMAML